MNDHILSKFLEINYFSVLKLKLRTEPLFEYIFKSESQKKEFLKLVTQKYPFVRTTKSGCGYILREGDARSPDYNERVIAVVRRKSIKIDEFETSDEARRENADARLSLINLCMGELDVKI